MRPMLSNQQRLLAKWAGNFYTAKNSQCPPKKIL